VDGVVNSDGFAIDYGLTFVVNVGPSEYLDKRGLARPVFPNPAVYFAGANDNTDALERVHTREIFPHLSGFNKEVGLRQGFPCRSRLDIS
jgi:hypothetical protein